MRKTSQRRNKYFALTRKKDEIRKVEEGPASNIFAMLELEQENQ
jgi:hypothetical protein